MDIKGAGLVDKIVFCYNLAMETDDFVAFFKKAEKLKAVLRHSWTSDKKRKESVAEHSWMVALLALISLPELKNKVNGEKILKLAIVHDLAEALAGDIPTHDQDGSDSKYKEEERAIKEIVSSLPVSVAQEVMGLWQEYEDQKTAEAKVVKGLDKLEVGFQHCAADFSTWDDNDKGYPLNYFRDYIKADPFLGKLGRINTTWRKKKVYGE